MAQTDRIGHGSKIERSSDGTSSGTFSEVGTIRDFTPPSVSRDSVETTHMGSPDRWRTFMGGLKDAAELQFEITFDPSSSEIDALYTDLNTDTEGYYKVTFPDDDEFGFAGLVTEISPSSPVDDKMVADVTIKLSGKPGWIV